MFKSTIFILTAVICLSCNYEKSSKRKFTKMLLNKEILLPLSNRDSSNTITLDSIYQVSKTNITNRRVEDSSWLCGEIDFRKFTISKEFLDSSSYYSLRFEKGILTQIDYRNNKSEMINYDLYLLQKNSYVLARLTHYWLTSEPQEATNVNGFLLYDRINDKLFFINYNNGGRPLKPRGQETFLDVTSIMCLDKNMYPVEMFSLKDGEIVSLSKFIYENNNLLKEEVKYYLKSPHINFSNSTPLDNFSLLLEKVVIDKVMIKTIPDVNNLTLPLWLWSGNHRAYFE